MVWLGYSSFSFSFCGFWMYIFQITLLKASLQHFQRLYMQYLKLDRDDFAKYVVCRKCYKCYEYGECLSEVNGKHVAKRCSNKLYSRGKAHLCNSQLVKKVMLKDNVTKFYPLHYYCFNSVINALERLVTKPGFPQKCEEWREDATSENVI